ncbi:MAG: GYF domain-containing protein [Fimbriimonadaceae bacterium]|jgi:hypothetical protein|nr:GYF domain-containing protein [Fimbriimonadaceae bacterium]
MNAPPGKAEWYYVGHYGQLGPLTLGQLKELAVDGVIDEETFVWRAGMSDWLPAKLIPDLKGSFGVSGPYIPPPVVGGRSPGVPEPVRPPVPPAGASLRGGPPAVHHFQAPVSDKSRVLAGVLNLVPGFGRFYLGYSAHGVLQLISSLCGIGYLWSLFDGIYILLGGVKYDGYGRRLGD